MIFKKFYLLIFLFITTLLSSFASASLFGNKGDDSGERKSIFDLLVRDERFKQLILHIEEAKLTQTFKSLKAGTVFAPVNEAFEDNDASIAQRKVTAEQLLYHVIPIAVKSDKLWHGRLLDTEARIDDVDQVVKVTTSSKDVFVGPDNGQEPSKVIQADMDASNGVIHLVDRIVPLPAYLDETLGMSEDTQHYYELAKKAHISHDLKNAKGNTIFVAKGDVFGDEVSPIERKYLENAGGRKDLARYLNHQITPNIYYSGDLKEGKSVVQTVEGSEDLEIFVENKKGSTSDIYVNGIKVIHRNILSANGVIHVLEKPLLPKKKPFVELTPRKILTGMNATRFVELFDENGLGSYLDGDHNDVTTILAPPNNALDEDSFVSKDKTKSWLKYHIIHGRYTPDDLEDGQLLETDTRHNLGDDAYQHIDVHIMDNKYGLNQFTKKNIVFGKSSVLDDPVDVSDKLIIYPIAQSLVLPRDPLSRLPVNLELSTFVASLYASAADEVIAKSRGITIFAPTNEAFGRLGLLAKYLLLPEAKERLEKVATYHAVKGVFYDKLVGEGELREPTLADSDVVLNKTKDGFFIRGSGAADGSDRTVIGQVVDGDILTSTGVIHTIDRVQLLDGLDITNRHLLSAEGTNSLLNLLERANLKEKVLDGLDKDKPYTILAPSDRAFGNKDLNGLLDDPKKLVELARTHILPIALPHLDLNPTSAASYDIFRRKHDDDKNKKDDGRKDRPEIPYLGVGIPTLNDDVYVVISKGITDGYTVKVKGSLTSDAEVINIGRASNNGGVLVIDHVLDLPSAQRGKGLPWWAIALIVIACFIGAAILAVAAYLGWRYYKSRREGYIALDRDH